MSSFSHSVSRGMDGMFPVMIVVGADTAGGSGRMSQV